MAMNVNGNMASVNLKELTKIKQGLLQSSVLKGKVDPKFIKGLTSDQVSFVSKRLKDVKNGKMSASKLVSWCQNKAKALKNNEAIQNAYSNLVKNQSHNKKGIFSKGIGYIKNGFNKIKDAIKNGKVMETVKNSFSKLGNVIKKHPIGAAIVGTTLAIIGAKVFLSGTDNAEE